MCRFIRFTVSFIIGPGFSSHIFFDRKCLGVCVIQSSIKRVRTNENNDFWNIGKVNSTLIWVQNFIVIRFIMTE